MVELKRDPSMGSVAIITIVWLSSVSGTDTTIGNCPPAVTHTNTYGVNTSLCMQNINSLRFQVPSFISGEIIHTNVKILPIFHLHPSVTGWPLTEHSKSRLARSLLDVQSTLTWSLPARISATHSRSSGVSGGATVGSAARNKRNRVTHFATSD